jgi:hypothetical protein
MKKTISLFFAVMLVIGRMNAQKPAVVVNDKSGWHKIAETTVSFDREKDEVAVMLADKFAGLKFKVTDAAIELLDLDISFEDGSTKNVIIGHAMKMPGESSRVIDLPGNEKSIKKIAFRYKTVPNRQDKRAHVEIYGLKTNADKGGNNGVKQDMKDAKHEAHDEMKDAKQDAKDATHNANKEMKDAKKDAKKEAKEVKKDAKKEAKEVKKDAKETKEEMKDKVQDN